jgi:putative membrane protein
MPGFLIRTLITMLGLYLASVLVPGVQIAGLGTFILAAILLGFVNGFVRPVAFFLTLPITIVTLGLFLLVLNAVGAMLSGFSIAGLGSAILGALIVSITSGIASWYIGPNGQIEVIVIRRD